MSNDNNTQINSRTGEAIIALLQLETGMYGRVDTSIGDKTAVGLAKTVQRIFNDEDFAKQIIKGE